MNPPGYVVISPVRNEEKHLGKTIDSVVSQTVKPAKWIIVNDGSTDQTGMMIEAAAARNSWIQVVNRGDRGFRKTGGGVIEAFNEGLKFIGDAAWEFIVKLDCDLSFPPGYFQGLLDRFSADQRLGIASGIYMEESRDSGWREIQMPGYHAAGASKVLRRECFEQIGGFIAERGWDTVDEIKAMARGWKTTHFPELKMKHWKPEGSGIGYWRTNLMLGEIYYLTGGSKLFFLLKLGHKFVRPPVFTGGLAMLLGYLKMSVKRQATLVSPGEAECYRALLNARIASQARRFFQIG